MKKIKDDGVSNCCGAPLRGEINYTCSSCNEPCEKEYLGKVVVLPTKNSEQSIIWGPTKIKLVNKQAEKLEKWGLTWNDDDWMDFMQHNCVPKETYEDLRTKLSFNWEEVAKEWERDCNVLKKQLETEIKSKELAWKENFRIECGWAGMSDKLAEAHEKINKIRAWQHTAHLRPDEYFAIKEILDKQ